MSRAIFFESYNQLDFCNAIGQEVNFVQDNQLFSKKVSYVGCIFKKQNMPRQCWFRSWKEEFRVWLWICVKILLPLPSIFSIELCSKSKKQLFVPRGFAHGFLTLSGSALVYYKCENYYSQEAEGGIRYDDLSLKIDWQFPQKEILVSHKDLTMEYL